MANAIVSQSGGPTGVINASLVGVIEEASKHKEIDRLFGGVHAVAGIVKEQFIDLKALSVGTLNRVAGSPSSALGSSRDKPNDEYCGRILEVFKKHEIRYFYYIGGNDSANTCYIINNMAENQGYQLRAFHVPKTVDNDLRVTDHCPGYGTAAKFVACALIGDDLDNRALPGIKIDVIMGRHAGFLTGAAVLGKQREDDGPHLVYIPERPFEMEQFLADVDRVYKKLGRCVIAVSEGVSRPDGKTYAEVLAENAECDAHGNVQLSGTGALADYLAAQVKSNLGVKRVRADTFGYLQRSFAGFQSPVDADEARRCGRQAVLYSLKEDNGSVAIKRLGNGSKYAVELFRTNLSEVAEHTKNVPDDYINTEGNGMTEAFMEYAKPLVGELPQTEYLGNYPKV